MSKETAQWYLEIVDAFLKDPRLSEWNYLPRDYFLAHLKETLKEIQEIETFAQAREILQKIINEEVLAPSIPEKDSLEYWKQELEKAKVERRKIKEESIRLVQIQVKRWEETSLLAKAIQAEEAKKIPLETEEEILAKNEASLTQKIRVALEDQDKSLTSDPDLSQNLIEEVKEIIVSEVLVNPDKEITNLRPQIDRKLQERGVALGRTKIKNFVENLSANAKPEILKIKEIGEKPLPDEVLTTLSQKTEAVAFSPLYAVLQPKGATAYVEKLIYTPAAKFLKSADVSPEWKEIIEKGIFAENIQETINTLKETGLSETHPTIRKLEARLRDVSSLQKNEKEQDRPGARIFKHYYHFEEITGKPLYDSKTKIFLSRKPIWSQGYSLRLREIFNKAGSAFRLYERIPLGPGKTVFRFSLPSKFVKFLSFGKFESFGGVQTWIFRQTVGKAVLTLGKPAVGKAVKEGIKKAATWLAVRLGIEAGVLAAGAALAVPTAGVSLVVAAAIEIGIKVIKIIWNRFFKPIVSAIVRLVKEPEKALGVIIVGAAIVVLVPAAAVFGFALIGLGALGFLSSLGGILGGVATGITSFFTTLFTLPASTAPVTALVLGTLGGLSALTFFIVMTTAAAFILPISPTRYTGKFPPSAISPTCSNLADMFSQVAQDNCIPPAILMAISQMEASGVWGWSCEEIAFFSTPNWWENATEEQKNRGYCYDTCARTGLCSGTTVMGPMQFEGKTWQGIMPGYSLMDRCRLDLSLLAAAKKIKANSETGPGKCSGWEEDIVRWKVAYHYCGSCGTDGCRENPNKSDLCSPACGYDYCGNVWLLYQQYANQ